MKTVSYFLVWASLALLAGCAVGPSKDVELAGALAGKWSFVRSSECCSRYEESLELRPDGTLVGNGVLRDARGLSPYSFEGEWKVEAGHLTLAVKRGARAGAGVPDEIRERIVSVTEWRLVTADPGGGVESTAWRYPK